MSVFLCSPRWVDPMIRDHCLGVPSHKVDVELYSRKGRTRFLGAGHDKGVD